MKNNTTVHRLIAGPEMPMTLIVFAGAMRKQADSEQCRRLNLRPQSVIHEYSFA